MGDMLESLFAVIVVVIAVVGAVNKANKKNKNAASGKAHPPQAQTPQGQTPQGQQAPAAQPMDRPLQAPPVPQPSMTQPAAASLRQGRPVMPSKKPPRRTPAPQRGGAAHGAAGSIAYVSPEGKEVHAPGFHGEKPPLLAMLDLEELDQIREAERARMARAAAAESAMPLEAARSAPAPRYTARQLREAFVMKEILDAPVSRRHGGRMPYGRW